MKKILINDPLVQALMKKCGGTHSEHDDQHQGMGIGMDHSKATDASKAASSANHEGHDSH